MNLKKCEVLGFSGVEWETYPQEEDPACEPREMGTMAAELTYTFARNEKKYVLDAPTRTEFMRRVADRLVPDAWGRSTVRSLYCDTPTQLMIRRSLEHPVYKEKIRIRSYRQAGPSDEVFLELKKKHKGMTYKRRATMTLERALEFVAGRGDPETQIEHEIAAAIARYDEGVHPVALVACEREAFFSESDPSLRITFDESIRWNGCFPSLSGGTSGAHLLPKGTCVMEIKSGEALPMWLARTLSEMGLFPVGFSKYGKAWSGAVTEARRQGVDWRLALSTPSCAVSARYQLPAPTSTQPAPTPVRIRMDQAPHIIKSGQGHATWPVVAPTGIGQMPAGKRARTGIAAAV